MDRYGAGVSVRKPLVVREVLAMRYEFGRDTYGPVLIAYLMVLRVQARTAPKVRQALGIDTTVDRLALKVGCEEFLLATLPPFQPSLDS